MLIEEIEVYAKNNHIPIMEHDGILFLTNYIKEHNVKNILEIGSAIGYSAIKMAIISKNIKVTTIERDQERYNVAKDNIDRMNLNSQITLILADALEAEINGEYDLIFIDAAKSQYIKFFEKYKDNLKNNGTIITDNINFHGLTNENIENLSRNLKGLIRKLNNYIDFLKKNPDFVTNFVDIGDGIAITQYKNK